MLEADAHKLADRIQRDFGLLEVQPEPEWRSTASAKVIDCVLSLRKNYERVVKPRVKGFVAQYPEVRTCEELHSLIDSYATPESFHAEVLRMNSPGKAAILVGVLRYLIDMQERFDGDTETERLRRWAMWTRPGDHLMLNVPGFKLAGFQYLRKLFGAETTKPDIHILRYIAETLGYDEGSTLSEQVRAIYLIERAGELNGVSVREVDRAIWQQRTRQQLDS